MGNSRYRPEIDGLRALAVLPVILFHAGVAGFGGGFVGVDVFFVVSGYLITGLIVADIEAGEFTILKFYERRARRILPALFVVLGASLVLGWLTMMPTAMQSLSASAVSVMFFASNLLFWSESGYFGAASEMKPLLHTWSLGVEEQFYIAFPLLLVWLWRFGKPTALKAIALGALASFILCQHAATRWPDFNFFSPLTRAWELGAGSLGALVATRRRPRLDETASALGLCAVLLSFFLVDARTPFPSVYALPPAIGAACVLVFGVRGTTVARMLSLAPLRGIGLVSYSAYLWHQPLLAFARISRASITLDGPRIAAVCLATLLLAYLSWRFVETPFRRTGEPSLDRRAFAGACASFGAFFVFAGVVGYASAGFAWRIPGAAVAALAAAKDVGAYRNACLEDPDVGDARIVRLCHMGAAKPGLDFLMIGDSFGAALADGVSSAAERAGLSGLFIGEHGCLPIRGAGAFYHPAETPCRRLQDRMASYAKSLGVKQVILHARWEWMDREDYFKTVSPGAATGYEAFKPLFDGALAEFERLGVRVSIVCCIPTTERGFDIPEAVARQIAFGDKRELRPSRASVLFKNRSALRLFSESSAKIVNVQDFFCAETYCEVARNGVPMFFDGDPNGGHITKATSQSLAPWLKDAFPTQTSSQSPAAAGPRKG